MFTINHDLLRDAGSLLADRPGVSWILGGAGSGKSTICAELARTLAMPVYDMDEHIYGSYFERYLPDRHPANTAWAAAEDGMAWLLNKGWDEFDAFSRAAAAEYLDLFAADIAQSDRTDRLLVDGGLYHPALLSRVIPSERIVCLAVPHLNSETVWTGTEERLAMKEMMSEMPDPDGAWRTFLEFDARMTETIANEAAAIRAPVVSRSQNEAVPEVAARVARAFGLE